MGVAEKFEIQVPDPLAITSTLHDIVASGDRLIGSLFRERIRKPVRVPEWLGDELGIGRAFGEATLRLWRDPLKLLDRQTALWVDSLDLWARTCSALSGTRVSPIIQPERGDRRFKDEAWTEFAVFDHIKQSYLLSARWLLETMKGVEDIDEQHARKVEFYTRQLIDALAPTNFALTNPEALREIFRTGGESLLRGLRNLMRDIERGKGRLSIRMTDLDAFTLGDNIATTPGSVVFQNDMMQLIQYAPLGDTVRRRPLLIVPPWINKFYILDLRDKNSFIRWAVAQGNTVFVISWINPDASYAARGFDDYLEHGITAALQAIERATGEREVNAVGYCLGGTLLSASTAWYAAGDHQPIASTTLFTTMLDFARPGELEVFIDDQQLDAIERRMQKQGYLDGAEMASTFNMLRANDLIWSFAVNNYLLGKDPFPFDLLYWNSDSTRMPAAMHSFYLRNMYQHNRLREPGGITLCGRPIDLHQVRTPVYFLSAVEDHIAPWKSTYAGTRLFGGPVRFVLGGSGHIAGVINPPAAKKYGYLTSPRLELDADEWLATATQTAGSWWPDWDAWLDQQDATRVPARHAGDGALAVLEPAPGSYVKRRLAR
ncbi:class I poly(R)-hydroxyalkanoic acid synthase [Plasticicumulans sp.]|uniref:class I poly(R)-hydroxyalkanoic acid synthase n=1 Tax=Plasticicumulans sp. TaxID=2307179 RepID=UPI00394B6C9B